MRKFRFGHECARKMKSPKDHETPKTRDNLVYFYRNGQYRCFEVKEIYVDENGEDTYRSTELNVQPKTFSCAPTLDFGLVGGFTYRGKLNTEKKLKLKDIDGKCIRCEKLIFCFHNDVLVDN